MASRIGEQKRTKTQIMQDIDRKLPALPRDQQNMVLAFAQGIRAGLAFRAQTMPPRATPKAQADEPCKTGQR